MEPGNLEARVTALETQVGELAGRVHASPASVLAAAADRDLAKFHNERRDLPPDHRREP